MPTTSCSTALIANNNTLGAPRWGLISPEEIKGIDMLYGPFSAAYPGNSIGGVMLLTTRMPEKLEATLKQTNAVQTFGYYSTHDAFTTSNTAGTIGSKVGAFSFFLSANREESFSQPLAFVTTAGIPADTFGTIGATNKTGQAANVVGASGLLHTIMDNYKLKWAVELNDWLTFSHTIGYWQNNAYSTVQSYLTQNGMPTFAGIGGFASGNYRLQEQHLANAVSLRSDTRGNWDFEVVGTYYTYLTSTQRAPSAVGPGLNFSNAGTNAQLGGTNWWTADAKGTWRPSGVGGPHEVSFGIHGDQYTLNNPTYALSSWLTSPDNGTGLLSSFGAGKTQTWGLWVQDKWKVAPDWTVTLGARGETWTAFNGYNITGNTAVSQPTVSSTDLSPKASVAWQINPEWSTKLNFGRAVRYPTVTELYQIVTNSLTNAVPNPNLLPKSALSFEWSVERQTSNSRARLTLFEEDTSNALIQQTSLINGVPTNNTQNVGLVRNRGVEVVGELTDVLHQGPRPVGERDLRQFEDPLQPELPQHHGFVLRGDVGALRAAMAGQCARGLQGERQARSLGRRPLAGLDVFHHGQQRLSPRRLPELRPLRRGRPEGALQVHGPRRDRVRHRQRGRLQILPVPPLPGQDIRRQPQGDVLRRGYASDRQDMFSSHSGWRSCHWTARIPARSYAL